MNVNILTNPINIIYKWVNISKPIKNIQKKQNLDYVMNSL